MNTETNNSVNKLPKRLNNFILNATTAAALTMSLLSCQSGTNTTEHINKGQSSGKQTLSESDYTEQNESYGSSVLVKSKVLTDQGRVKVEQQLKETSLESLNLPSYLNVQAFTISSRSNIKTKPAVYIAPKLYLYRKADKAHVKVRKVGNNVLIPLHAILVDGFSKEIPSVDGVNKVTLPASYLVDEPQLKQALLDRGFNQEKTSYGPLDGCPKKFTLSVAGSEYDITPNYFVGSDQCEINRPFTLNLVVPADQADFIINEALYYNEVDVQSEYEVLVGYLDADTHIQLNRSKIFEKLQASLAGQYPPYAKAELQLNLKKIIQSETLSIFIKGDRNSIIDQLINAAYDAFTVPFELKDADDAAKAKCENTVCLNVSYTKNEENKSLEVSYQQFSTTLTGQRIASLAKAQQILFPEVVFTSFADNKLTDYISNLDQNERQVLVTVNQGSIIEVNLENFRYQKDNVDLDLSISGSTRCGSYDITKRCEWHENIINVTRTYSGISFSENQTPAGNLIGNPYDDLKLKFKNSFGATKTCSFGSMNATSDGSRFYIKVQNTPACEIFNNFDSGAKEQLQLSIINDLKDTKHLKKLNDGKAFSYTDTYSAIDAEPQADKSTYGGTQPILTKESQREIQLQIKILVRKFDLD